MVPEEIFTACMRPSRGLVLGMWLLGHLNGNNSNGSTQIFTLFFLCELLKLTVLFPKNKSEFLVVFFELRNEERQDNHF